MRDLRHILPQVALAAVVALAGCDGTGVEPGGDGGQSMGGAVGEGGKTGTGGRGSSGGRSDNGGTVGSGGAAGATTGAGGADRGGATATNGGRASSGGALGLGGATGQGGRQRVAGTLAMGGGLGTGGVSPQGGTRGTGGAAGGGGTVGLGSGGATGVGGGTGAGGNTGACTPAWQDPPANVSAWIDASWNAQLGTNIKTRQAWLVDNVMKGQGQINICVRWGASSAPSAEVKANMASATEKWFNDWFKNLADYGCFPYAHITAKVTGWAVKPGNTAWVSGLDSTTIKVYTETDPEGEPRCPSACSFFDNWSHTFPNCPGGEAFHTDYWIWLDDQLPGGGGAAAVGGDWGLRMPVSGFLRSMGQSDFVIEHEMGHGFGFQDYYDWTGPTPAGGSLMIVGSTNNQAPTTADMWLLRRTWKEMKILRGF